MIFLCTAIITLGSFLTRSFSDNLNSDVGKFNTGCVVLKYLYNKELVRKKYYLVSKKMDFITCKRSQYFQNGFNLNNLLCFPNVEFQFKFSK